MEVVEIAPLIVTSLAPNLMRGEPPSEEAGKAYQKECANSWIKAGATVISLNSRVEIAILEDEFPGVNFIRSYGKRTAENPKGLPTIPELLSVGVKLRGDSTFAIANSDISFRGDSVVLKELFSAAEGGVVYANRFECSEFSKEPVHPYSYGYDLVILDSRYVVTEELRGFFIGSPWWDYLLLYLMASRDVPMSTISMAVISHLTHNQVWDANNWRKGLGKIAHRIRCMATEEGPAAALLAILCDSLIPENVRAFGMESIVDDFGTALGVAMVAYIAQRTEYTNWFELEETKDGLLPRGSVKNAQLVPPFN